MGQALASSQVYEAHSSLQKKKEELEIENARITVMQVSSEKDNVLLESKRRTEQREHDKALIESQKKVEKVSISLRKREEEIKQIKTDPSWMLDIKEVTIMTDQQIGIGGWAIVTQAQFRGIRVAAKRLHEKIISDFNLQLFKREIAINAELRHPNLVLFIGATVIDKVKPVILMELMPTNLNEELKKSKLSKKDIISISQDVAHGLMYLHQWKPLPILHRDISSKNILLEHMSSGWRAKVSDYGTANFQDAVATINPGCIPYSAPEARNPDQQSPKMDVYSFGVLLIEMCVCDSPQESQHWRKTSIKKIKWPTMVSLIETCIQCSIENRPTMNDVLKKLQEIGMCMHVYSVIC